MKQSTNSEKKDKNDAWIYTAALIYLDFWNYSPTILDRGYESFGLISICIRKTHFVDQIVICYGKEKGTGYIHEAIKCNPRYS